MQERNRVLVPDRCRTCNISYQAPANMVWRCDTCGTANGVGNSESGHVALPLSVSKTQDAIDHAIEDGMAKLDSCKPEAFGMPPPSPTMIDLTSGAAPASRKSLLLPPKKPSHQAAQRRAALQTLQGRHYLYLVRQSPSAMHSLYVGRRRARYIFRPTCRIDHVAITATHPILTLLNGPLEPTAYYQTGRPALRVPSSCRNRMFLNRDDRMRIQFQNFFSLCSRTFSKSSSDRM